MSDTNETAKVKMVEHLVVKDVETGEVVLDFAETDTKKSITNSNEDQ